MATSVVCQSTWGRSMISSQLGTLYQLTQRWLRLLLTLSLTVGISLGSMADVAHARGMSPDHAPELSFEECDLTTSSLIRDTLKRLPAKLMALSRVQVRCVDRALPYGFSVRLVNSRAELTLGDLAPIKEERARYRLAHLSPEARRKVWRARGLVHALTLYGARAHQWHLSPLFRGANSWSEAGDEALNLDSWGYSRALGQDSALYDFVTFAEEWFVRGPDRPSEPDNRVECQSFTKGRALTRIFAPQLSDEPPRECEQFYAWSDRYSRLDLIFTSPSSAVISSFGHLALLLHNTPREAPEYEDPVLQYVGLLEGETRQQITQLISDEIPLILQPQSFVSFDRQNRYLEDRSLRRYRVLISPKSLLWVKARLWEQVRRLESRYGFSTENCARQILRLFEATTLDETLRDQLDQLGPTTSPLGVISLLRAQGLLSSESTMTPGISDQLSALRDQLLKAQDLLPNPPDAQPTPALSEQLSEQMLSYWSSWLKGRSLNGYSDEQLVHFVRYVHLLQDYFDLAGWVTPSQPSDMIPVRVIEALELKHDIFRVEKAAVEVIERIQRWDEEHALGERPISTQARLADRLVESLSDQLSQPPLSSLDLDEESTQDQTTESAMNTSSNTSEARWGSDGALTFTALGQHPNSSLDEVFIRVTAALYDERQGVTRSAILSPTRDLRILEISLKHSLGAPAGQLALTPLYIANRRGAWGIDRLGFIFNTAVAMQWSDELDGAVDVRGGQSAQVLRWWGGRGDISVGLLGSARADARSGGAGSIAAFAWLTLPLTESALLWLRSEHELSHTHERDSRWTAQLTAAWRIVSAHGASKLFFAELKRELNVWSELGLLTFSGGVRWQ